MQRALAEDLEGGDVAHAARRQHLLERSAQDRLRRRVGHEGVPAMRQRAGERHRRDGHEDVPEAARLACVDDARELARHRGDAGTVEARTGFDSRDRLARRAGDQRVGATQRQHQRVGGEERGAHLVERGELADVVAQQQAASLARLEVVEEVDVVARAVDALGEHGRVDARAEAGEMPGDIGREAAADAEEARLGERPPRRLSLRRGHRVRDERVHRRPVVDEQGLRVAADRELLFLGDHRERHLAQQPGEVVRRAVLADEALDLAPGLGRIAQGEVELEIGVAVPGQRGQHAGPRGHPGGMLAGDLDQKPGNQRIHAMVLPPRETDRLAAHRDGKDTRAFYLWMHPWRRRGPRALSPPWAGGGWRRACGRRDRAHRRCSSRPCACPAGPRPSARHWRAPRRGRRRPARSRRT